MKDPLDGYITVDCGDGYRYYYLHCSEVLIPSGKTVEAGDVIARVGRTEEAPDGAVRFYITYHNRFIKPVDFFR